MRRHSTSTSKFAHTCESHIVLQLTAAQLRVEFNTLTQFSPHWVRTHAHFARRNKRGMEKKKRETVLYKIKTFTSLVAFSYHVNYFFLLTFWRIYGSFRAFFFCAIFCTPVFHDRVSATSGRTIVYSGVFVFLSFRDDRINFARLISLRYESRWRDFSFTLDQPFCTRKRRLWLTGEKMWRDKIPPRRRKTKTPP